MLKWLKLFVAIVLLPACYTAGLALFRVIAASGRADTFWVAFLSGAGCWLIIYLLLPKPMLLYVFGHELTHALWTWAMGGKVKRFKASSKGGSVSVTKNNFLIALAPYFFPLYAILVVLVFVAGNAVWDWSRHVVYFHLLLGAAYAFHVTLTAQTLRTQQSDIDSQGYIFSAVTVFLGNVIVLLAGIPLLTVHPDITVGFRWWWQETLNLVPMLIQMRRGA